MPIASVRESTSRKRPDGATVVAWSWFGLLAFLVALLTLLFGVLAFGAVEEWAVAVLECGAALALALWAAGQMALGRLRLQSKALIPGAALLILPIFQLATRHSEYLYATRYELLQWCAYGVFFLIASECTGSPALRRYLAYGITAFGAVYALFAIMQGFVAPPNVMYGFIRVHGTGFGSYVNRNHFAGLMEMLLPFGLVSATSSLVKRPLRLVWFVCSLLMLASIFVSGSRGGMISVSCGLILFAILYWRQHRGSKAARSLVLAGVVAFCFVAYLSHDRVAGRAPIEATDAIRVQIARDSLQLVKRQPLLGSGLGTFTAVYPQVCSFPTDLFINAAHNDYVQLAVETGLAGVFFAAAFLWLVLGNAIRRQRRRNYFSAVSRAAMIGIVVLMVHSLFDFNLQIPANAATFAFLCGLAAAEPEQTEQKRSSLSRAREEQ